MFSDVSNFFFFLPTKDILKFKIHFQELGFFLRCNQCIHTLHLSYETPPYDDFHFWVIIGFKKFQTPNAGVKLNFFLNSYGIGHLKPPRPETYPYYSKKWNKKVPSSNYRWKLFFITPLFYTNILYINSGNQVIIRTFKMYIS